MTEQENIDALNEWWAEDAERVNEMCDFFASRGAVVETSDGDTDEEPAE